MAGPLGVDLREILIDAHAHFFFLKGVQAMRVRLWQILSNSVVIGIPTGAAMHKTVLGYVPTIDGTGVYEIEGTVNPDPLPDQMPETIRIDIDPARVRRVNRRIYPRHRFFPPLEAHATPEGEKKSVAIKILDFSAGGLRIESTRALSTDKRHHFRFRIELEDEIHDLELDGIIVYELPDSDHHRYGVKFTGPADAREAEASVETLDQTVDLLGLVNRLLIRA